MRKKNESVERSRAAAAKEQTEKKNGRDTKKEENY